MATIWTDPDFINLDAGPQRLYLFLLSQPDLSHAGLVPMRINRWAKKVNGASRATILADLDALAYAQFVVADQETEEVLIRTFVRNDGVYKQPKVMLRMREDARQIESDRLRRTFRDELDRLPLDELNDEASNAAAKSTKQQVSEVVDSLRADFGYPSEGVSDGVTDTPRVRAGAFHLPPTPVPQPPSTGHRDKPLADESADMEPVDHFEEFWETYGYKVKRADALKAWNKAVKKTAPQTIIAAAASYVEFVRADKAERGNRATDQAHAATWLNGERWNDERSIRTRPQSRVQEHLTLVQQLAAEEAEQQQHLEIGHQR